VGYDGDPVVDSARTPPEIRASWTRRVLRMIDALPKRDVVECRSRIRADSLSRLENAAPLEWLPAEIHAQVIEVLRNHVGPERYRQLYTDMTLDGLNRPLFGPLARAAVSMFGRSAVGLERVFPRGWGLVARGCGRIHMTSSAKGRAEMLLEDLPPGLSRTDTYALGFAGAFDACGIFAGSTERSCVVDTSELGEGRVRYRLAWDE